MSAVPRVAVSAPSSGHGKTAVCVGLLAAYAARGLRAVGFKVGPDHVDAAYASLASGRPAHNLDPRLVGAHRIGPLFAHAAAGADIAVVEGTMGLYDALTATTDGESTAQVAGLLRAPVVLVVDAGAMGQSVAALVHGFRSYDELTWLGGVILNRVASGRHERLLRETLDDIGVPVLGALRRGDLAAAAAGLPARGQGVVPAVQGGIDAVHAVRRLGGAVAARVDLERLLVLARSAPQLAAPAWSPALEVAAGQPTGELSAAVVRRAAGEAGAGDAGTGGPAGAGTAVPAGPGRPVVALAEGYGYPETAQLLAAAGAEVAGFDPLRDEALPPGASGLVVGAGLPESYADELCANERLRGEVAALAAAGAPVVAEGAGLVWLCRELDGRPMCGVLDASAHTADATVLGYREATAQTSRLLPAGTRVVGHKLHRTLVSPRAGASPAWSWPGGAPEGFVSGGVHASYLALHWAGSPGVAVRLVAAARGAAGPAAAAAA
jgi:cobyrinic acid a,c-diamide synthase